MSSGELNRAKFMSWSSKPFSFREEGVAMRAVLSVVPKPQRFVNVAVFGITSRSVPVQGHQALLGQSVYQGFQIPSVLFYRALQETLEVGITPGTRLKGVLIKIPDSF